MPKIYKDIIQGSKEWFDLRIGSLGGSQVSKALSQARGGNGPGKTSMDLLYKLATEILTNEKIEQTPTEAMERGTRLEPIARRSFEFITELEVEQVGLIKGDIPHTHYSPDGICSYDFLLEIKCPLYHTQLKRLNENRLPPEYKPQVQYGIWLGDYLGCYFFSYHPDLDPLIIKVFPDEKYISDMKNKVVVFTNKLIEIVERHRS